MSGQYMKPKKINDHFASSDFRSKTPFSSSTRMNSASGRRSGKVTRAGGMSISAEAVRPCHSAQYPDPASASPTAAAATSTTIINFSRVIVLTTDPAPMVSLAQSDNCTLSPSILPAWITKESGQPEGASSKLPEERHLSDPVTSCSS